MRSATRLLLPVVLPGLAVALWVLGGMALFYAALSPERREGVSAGLAPALAEGGALIFGWWLAGAVLAGWLAARLYARHVAAPARLADAARLLAGNADAPRAQAAGPEALSGLAEALNRLADERRTLQTDMARLVAEAQHKVAQERDQLGALMAELRQSVIVCNLDGRILLYNDHARSMFRRVSGGGDVIGLGRSIHTVIERALIDHARDTVDRHIARGEAPVSAQFVTTTPAGSLLHVVLAPVRPQAGESDQISGYVLLVDDITGDYAAQSRRDRRLIELTEASRASLANMQAALDMLDYPDLQPAERDGFHAIVRDEVTAMGQRLKAMTADASQEILTRWPLQEMLGDDLLAAASRHVQVQTGAEVAVGNADDGLWLRVDSFSLIQALGALAVQVAGAQSSLTLRLAPAATPGWAHLDLVWPLEVGTGPGTAGAVAGQAEVDRARDIAERHGGELWLEQDRPAGQSFFRFLLPTALSGPEIAWPESRPEFYDFDLFAASDSSRSLDDQPLDQLTYTVFDTETTGLNPAEGDEIIQIGAVRILNGKLLLGERFDQIVDPGREIPEASIPYHGIHPEMVQGQPRIAEVLPVFHAYAADTVLVGHNVAFDMRFLQMKEGVTGLRFDQPVLDTLLLASIAQPHEPSHSLEAIAERLGIEVANRHNAAGDALVTAQVFLRLWPLLQARGIATLGQARAAAENSYYARLRY
ncbi:3'-5' exonuclease [Paracoccus kondratievae]|uniref:DNA-directed DNA polymerase n=1 Tax=Paracoccus kondratievae TaxID=135740 RepID=A0AAD3P1G3_9RHOB|nr:exonuclease domain-containing protein [Paracoccus kondratievae]GLK65556.1 DNA polymerase III subunit epsilon [Paracoccus kondratievae]